VGPWDLHRDLGCVPVRPEDGTVVIVESVSKSRALPYHRKKLVLVRSAMHHFARHLQAEGFDVEVVRARSYLAGIRKHVERVGADEVVALMPREWGIYRAFVEARDDSLDGALGARMTLLDDGGAGGHFLLPRDGFGHWAGGRKQLRMQHFYSHMRKHTGWLVDDEGKPEGGKWSFDTENRKPPGDARPPPAPHHEPDDLTHEIMSEVADWDGFWGEVEGFGWAVTREQALADLDDFFAQRADQFGPYQDAMLGDEPFMWHTLISTSLNLGLLHPAEVCARIVSAYAAGDMPLASAEGLLRQILGWREYIRGMYWHRMPELRSANALGGKRRLPQLYWDESHTDMRCLEQSVRAVRAHGYAHHIQRLMVLGNFALLCGVEPIELSHWFWAGFVDAFEWVQLPNVHGMAMFANTDFTTKPYAASGNYIHKMSNYCGDCAYSVRKKHGDEACPFNHLFWHFMEQHRDLLADNPRLGMLYRTWDKMKPEDREAILRSSASFLGGLRPADHDWSFHDDQG